MRSIDRRRPTVAGRKPRPVPRVATHLATPAPAASAATQAELELERAVTRFVEALLANGVDRSVILALFHSRDRRITDAYRAAIDLTRTSRDRQPRLVDSLNPDPFVVGVVNDD